MSDTSTSFLPYGRQTISQSDIAAVLAVLNSPFLTQGPLVPAFEKAVSSKVGSSYAVAVNSATSALHIACLASGLAPGDLLWTSPLTFVSSANCARYCGAEVDFVDIDPRTGLISIDSLEHKLKCAAKVGRLPKVFVPVHFAGSSCDMEAISELANQYNFSVIEDASHAIGGKYKNQYVGSCKYSNICVFSFHPVKIITTGEGGVATTNSPELARLMSDLRSHGITKDPNRFQSASTAPWVYEQQTLGFNYRLTDIQAALGLSQLERLDEIVEERNRQFLFYQKLLKDLPVQLLAVPQDVLSSVHLCVIRLKHASISMHRRVFEGLRAAGIGVQLHYSPVHLQPYYRNLGFSEGDFIEAETYAQDAMSLPLYPGLEVHQQERVVDTISNLLV